MPRLLLRLDCGIPSSKNANEEQILPFFPEGKFSHGSVALLSALAPAVQ